MQSSAPVSTDLLPHENFATGVEMVAEPRRCVKIVWLYFYYHSKHPFICLAKESLCNSGHSVVVLDLENEPSPAQLPAASILDSANFSSRPSAVLGWALNCICRAWACFNNGRLRRFPGARWSSKLLWLLWMALKTVAEKPDVIVVTAPEAAAIGWMANAFLHVRLVYYPFELYGDQVCKLPWRWRAFKSLFLRNGISALITQNEERAKIYVNEKGVRVRPVIVHNYKRMKRVVSTGRLRQQLNLPEDIRIVLYEGVIQAGRWLQNLALSAEFLPDDTRLVFMGEASSWWKTNMEPLLKTPKLAHKVLLAPWVPHAELLTHVADADVGVIIYDDSVRNNYYCEPGKLSDYVIAGVPVIAPGFPTIGPVIRRHGVGVVFDNPAPAEIARAINQVLSTPKAEWLRRIEIARKELVWETQSPVLEKAILGFDN